MIFPLTSLKKNLSWTHNNMKIIMSYVLIMTEEQKSFKLHNLKGRFNFVAIFIFIFFIRNFETKASVK